MATFFRDTKQQAREVLIDFPANWVRQAVHPYSGEQELWHTADGAVSAHISRAPAFAGWALVIEEVQA